MLFARNWGLPPPASPSPWLPPGCPLAAFRSGMKLETAVTKEQLSCDGCEMHRLLITAEMMLRFCDPKTCGETEVALSPLAAACAPARCPPFEPLSFSRAK